jgi:uncharacterized protein
MLWTLLGLFVLRVLGQGLVAFAGVQFLPPMQEWYSGLMPYEFLLPSQILLIVLMTWICIDFTRASGPFYAPRRLFAVYWLYFGWIYLAAMVGRFVWFGLSIPVAFHWVLAAFMIAVGLSHRRRLAA